MTTFKDYLRDIYDSKKVKESLEEEFDTWMDELEWKSDKLWELFMEYLWDIYVSRKIGKIAYIVLENQ